ncbi:MAG: TetR/AcrR family transcriptional regulator [Candidatus Obscuribacterales bacterium]|nr:TetR/AcrR family transcriptional regulator [Steroidobacteraceae bacterium]
MKRPRSAALKNFGDTPLRLERVLTEASRQLNANGLSLTSVADIATTLGISRAALYYYVEDRENLVFLCYRRTYETIARHLGEAIRLGSDAADAIGLFVDRMLDPTQPEIATRAEISCLNAERHQIIQGLHDAITTRLAHLLEVGARAGILRNCDSEVAAATILSMITWAPLSRHWTEMAKQFGHGRVLATVKTTILAGLFKERGQLPDFKPFDLSPLIARAGGVFDRRGLSDVKRDTLLAVASRLFTHKGIDSTSLEEIAAQAGVSKRTLYHHVGDKEAVVAACYRRALRTVLFIKDRMLAYDGPPVQALAAAYHAISIVLLSDDLTPIFPLTGYRTVSPQTKEDLYVGLTELGIGYFRVMSTAIADGTLVEMDIPVRQVIIFGAFSWLAHATIPNIEEQHAHTAREISNLLCIGVGRAG